MDGLGAEILLIKSCNVCVPYFCLFSNKLNLLEATWSILAQAYMGGAIHGASLYEQI